MHPEKSQLDTLDIYFSMIMPKNEVERFLDKFRKANKQLAQNAIMLFEGKKKVTKEDIENLLSKG